MKFKHVVHLKLQTLHHCDEYVTLFDCEKTVHLPAIGKHVAIIIDKYITLRGWTVEYDVQTSQFDIYASHARCAYMSYSDSVVSITEFSKLLQNVGWAVSPRSSVD